jgi:hypothetical protein
VNKNQRTIDTSLEGFINLGEPSGKYNNCCFAFRIPEDQIEEFEKTHQELLAWGKSKLDNPGRVAVNPTKWDDEGLVKYSFDGETGRKRPHFIDTVGDVVPTEVLNSVRKGTKVRIIVNHTPYTKPALGTTLKVLGVQIVELVSGNGAVDRGEDLTADEIADMFGVGKVGEIKGFEVAKPAVQQTPQEVIEAKGYDF